MSSDGLRTCNKIEKAAKAAGAAIALLMAYNFFVSLYYVRDAVGHSVRPGRSLMLVIMGALIGACFAYLLIIGATAAALDMYKKNRLRWSIYRTGADGKRSCVGRDLSHEEMTVQMSQMSNRDSGAIYEGLPE